MVTPLLFLAAPIAAFFLSFTSHFSAAGPRYAVKVDYSGTQKGLAAKVIPPGEQAFTLLFTWPLPVPALRRGRCQQSAPKAVSAGLVIGSMSGGRWRGGGSGSRHSGGGRCQQLGTQLLMNSTPRVTTAGDPACDVLAWPAACPISCHCWSEGSFMPICHINVEMFE